MRVDDGCERERRRSGMGVFDQDRDVRTRVQQGIRILCWQSTPREQYLFFVYFYPSDFRNSIFTVRIFCLLQVGGLLCIPRNVQRMSSSSHPLFHPAVQTEPNHKKGPRGPGMGEVRQGREGKLCCVCSPWMDLLSS